MPVAIQPVILTQDLNRLLDFYSTLFGAKEIIRVPDDGPAFYVGLQVGESTLGLVSNTGVETAIAQRILLSVGVQSVDKLLEQVDAAGGRLLGPPTDMPWGQRVAHLNDPDGNAVNLTQQV